MVRSEVQSGAAQVAEASRRYSPCLDPNLSEMWFNCFLPHYPRTAKCGQGAEGKHMIDELSLLRGQLCTGVAEFCRECFTTSPYAATQNPPNVFRVGKNLHAKTFFIFDKPNDNDSFRTSALVPIVICDPRPIFGPPPTHRNLLVLLDKLSLSSASNTHDPLESDAVHFTNAVKCDKCAVTGKTGRVVIGEIQVRNCMSKFLLRELVVIKPVALVFFGEAPQQNVLGYTTPVWAAQPASIADATYWVMRVPHTSPQSFNTHGGKGDKYIAPFRNLMEWATSTRDETAKGIRQPIERPTGPAQRDDQRRPAICTPAIQLLESSEPSINMQSKPTHRGSADIPFDSRMYRTTRPYDGRGKREAIWKCWKDGCTVEEFVKKAREVGQGGPEDVRIYYHLGVIRIEPHPKTPIRKPR